VSTLAFVLLPYWVHHLPSFLKNPMAGMLFLSPSLGCIPAHRQICPHLHRYWCHGGDVGSTNSTPHACAQHLAEHGIEPTNGTLCELKYCTGIGTTLREVGPPLLPLTWVSYCMGAVRTHDRVMTMVVIMVMLVVLDWHSKVRWWVLLMKCWLP
jgi:hypothetical protein